MSSFQFENTKAVPTDAELLADLQRVKDALGGSTVSVRDYNRLGAYASATFKKRFGSWNKALIAAGLLIGHRHSLPDEELWDNLREVWIRLGRQPRKAEMQKPLSRFTHDPYTKRYGGWLAAMRAFAGNGAQAETDENTTLRTEPATPRNPRTASLRVRFEVMRRDRFRCCACGRSPASTPGLELHVDHVRAWSKSGPTEPENLQTLCSDCNLGKSNGAMAPLPHS
jgi:hypothetical protein